MWLFCRCKIRLCKVSTFSLRTWFSSSTSMAWCLISLLYTNKNYKIKLNIEWKEQTNEKIYFTVHWDHLSQRLCHQMIFFHTLDVIDCFHRESFQIFSLDHLFYSIKTKIFIYFENWNLILFQITLNSFNFSSFSLIRSS